jgi:hypothetical protein
MCLNNPEPIATAEEFKAALLAARDWNRISPLHLPMLQLQCRAPDCALSASQMARELKLKNVAVARLRYGTFARTIAERLGYTPPRKRSGAPRWWLTLSTSRGVGDEGSDDQCEWIMRPELAAALRVMKWV